MATTTRERSLPLTHIQQGMLFHHLSGGHRGVDLEQIVGDLPEALDLDAFQEAWSLVAARHPAMRMRFRWEDVDAPVQETLPSVDVSIHTADWRDRPSDEREGEFTAFVAEDRARGFELSDAPLFRVALFRLADAHYRLLWSFPHIILDGRSFIVVLRDVFETYEAVRAGRAPVVSEDASFPAFVEWLDGRTGEGDSDYWRELLRGLRSATPLPYDRGAAAGASPGEAGRGERQVLLTAEATSGLRDFASRHGLTVNTLVQGAWGLVLARHSGEGDVAFGATRAGRYGTVEGADDAAGVFINTLPVRARFDAATLLDDLRALRDQHVAVRAREHTPLVAVQAASELGAGSALFHSLIVFDRETLGTALRGLGGDWERRDFRLLERTSFPLTLYGYGEEELLLKLAYDTPRFDDGDMDRLLGHLRVALESMPSFADRPAAALPLLSDDERSRLLVEWNETTLVVEPACVHHLFEEQARRTPDRVAAVCGDREMSYRELDEAANRLAHRLRELGIGPDVLAGLCVDRSLDLLVGVLGIQKAGGAYVPLDPEYPADRIAYMIEHSGAGVILTQAALEERLPAFDGKLLRLDADWSEIAKLPPTPVDGGATPENLAYVIYTSGSTGRPKGVMVEHRNVANFFAGMDDHLGVDPDGALLAVTSLSFDISVLELFWTLCRGQKAVIFKEDRGTPRAGPPPRLHRTMDFSLFYFSSDEGADAEKYRLLREGALFADRNGFSAVWTPERHFHAFGGLFPNPAVTGAAIATLTENVQIRSGSVVLPLHHPIRVAEEWSVVDNLSNGRVGISVASGWQPNDFVLAPDNHARRNALMYENLETIRKLWRGETLQFDGPKGPVDVRVLPRPVQAELPVWITTAGSPETFRRAGEVGANILTHLLGQTVASLSENLAIYRAARRAAGHEGRGIVTLMLHTFVGDDRDAVREAVREPMKNYLRSAVSLVKGFANEWTAYSKRAQSAMKAAGDEFQSLAPEDLEALLDFAFERYFETSGLFGTPESCQDMVDRLKAIGVDEIGCLIDFGVPADDALGHLEHLNRLKELANREPEIGDDDFSFAAQIARHRASTLQCTPSMATMLLASEDTRNALGALDWILVGGEAFPAALARELRGVFGGGIVNMYGPTETTVWSSTHQVMPGDDPVPLGKPIANTTFYVLDSAGQPVPVGVPGELYIGGDGVVRGYFGRDDLTAERFVADPFAGTTDARMYRTGDVVRYRADGTLDFLGRADNQVKIRGHRIELGEIEAVLSEHAGVQQAVVVARPGATGDPLLVAYLVPENGAAPGSQELRDRLRQRLPEFMVPSIFVTLRELPLTPNAKVDRNALPEPEQVEPVRQEEFVAPGNDLEQSIARIWQEILNLPRVGRRDSFFDLGGHSLLTVQVHARLRKELGLDLPLTDLFRFPTIQGLAEHLGGAGESKLDQGINRADARRQSMLRRQRRA
jgi:natural product biosynthesis luciferase-like monooxygenase protein